MRQPQAAIQHCLRSGLTEDCLTVTWPQREEDLSGGVHPDLGLLQPRPVWGEIVGQALGGPGQGEAADRQDEEDEVGEEGGEVGHLPAGLDPLDQAAGHQEPGGGQAGQTVQPDGPEVVPAVAAVPEDEPLVVLGRGRGASVETLHLHLAPRLSPAVTGPATLQTKGLTDLLEEAAGVVVVMKVSSCLVPAGLAVLLTPAGGGVVPVTTVDPLQSGAEAGRQVPDGPAYHHDVVEGQEEADTDHGIAQAASNGSHLTEYLDRTNSSILAQGYLEYLSVNKVTVQWVVSGGC